MKTRPSLLATFLFCFCLFTNAQKRDLHLYLKNGTFQTANTITSAWIDSFNRHTAPFQNKAVAIWQFENFPSEAVKKELAANGIELLEYVPQNAYLVSSTGKLQGALLQQWGVRTITRLSAKQKIHPALTERQPAGKRNSARDVQIVFPKSFHAAEVTTALKEKGISVTSSKWSAYGVLTVRVATSGLEELAALPFVLYAQPDQPKDQALNFKSRVSARGYGLNQSVANGGRGLNGEGVVLGIGDDGDVQFHADFSGRLINRTTQAAAVHATHTHGTAAGAGIITEQYRGYAPKVTIISQDFNDILAYAPLYAQEYGMAITSNSYGNVTGCGTMGEYDFSSYILDQQAFDFPALQHVFAAGNSGGNACGVYPRGYNTVLTGYQTAKNVLTVGNVTSAGAIVSNSSRGPVTDGRLKPEITALGYQVNSTIPGNGYGALSGTSMAAPAVSGGLALLYQRYRQLHGNQDPRAGLMKALLCNGAEDKGTPGPDYTYGFGFMNLERSVTMLEANQFFSSTVTNGTANTHAITVPPNTAQLKVMLYWNDPPPAFVSSRNLVNDLDLRVFNPSAVATYPKVLNPSPGAATSAALEGEDHINNIEQVIINNPAVGAYTINIQGDIAQNPRQEYFIVYDFVMAGTQLAFPAGGTVLTPGETATVAWDSYGGTATTFNLQYSADSGVTWTTIQTGIAAASRTFAWTVPAQVTGNAMMRLTKTGTALTSTSRPFTIIGTPAVTLEPTQCEGYINVGWLPVAGATDYEVLLLRGTEMLPVATTAAVSYSIGGLSKDSTYYIGVRARTNGKPGWRSKSLLRQPNTGNCQGSISDNDLKLEALVAPYSGRIATATSLGTTAVSVSVKNLDDLPVTGFTMKYRINGGAWVIENVSATIAAGEIYTHTFNTTEDFSAAGSYIITGVVAGVADVMNTNDTLTTTIQQLENIPLNLTTPFLDDLESATPSTYVAGTNGLENADRYDFSPSAYGRLRTYINTGVAFSGNQALVIDVDRNLSPSNSVQYLRGTYNLSPYHSGINDLRLQFQSLNGAVASPANRVWIRGSDSQPWIELYAPLTYGTSSSLEVGNTLRANGQDFSSSFQIRWGVPAIAPVASLSSYGGLLLDDISLYEAFNDMQLLAIDTPYTLRCALSNAVPVAITLRNSSGQALNHVPVRYRINNGTWVVENVASIPANTNLLYTFAAKADLSIAGVYQVTAEVAYPGDSYPDNNTTSVTVYNSPTVTSFPYLQNFEAGDGGWYAGGSNASWQYGTPASAKINGAASGTKAWKTALAGNYNDNERSYLYSPCFDIAGITRPALSFSVALDLENCGAYLCDGAWVEYSIDNKTWYNLADLNNTGTNWYKAPHYAWSIENNTAWHVATLNLPTGYSNIRFRFVLRSDAGVTREGIGIDDIHIYDNAKGIYAGATLTAPVTKAVSGNGWVDFVSGGQLLASISPNNQDLGTTSVQAYIDAGAARYTAEQYYLDRNITIKPANRNPAAPVTVRLYFLATEMDSLTNATGCLACTKPASVSDLGISKYSTTDLTTENGTLSDDKTGDWSFLLPADVAKVPFDKGYYAEFEVTSFSEFWFNNGGTGNYIALPLRLIDFTAKREGPQVVLNWITADEQNVARYVIEVARGNEEFKKNQFQPIGTVESDNTTAQRQYGFSDDEAFKSGVRYYRLKMMDKDGSFHYSGVRSVFFSETLTWQVYPNPSQGVFHLVYQAAAGEDMPVQITDVAGRTIKTVRLHTNGFMQKQIIDLTTEPNGVYLLQMRRNGALQSLKLYKQ